VLIIYFYFKRLFFDLHKKSTRNQRCRVLDIFNVFVLLRGVLGDYLIGAKENCVV